MLHGTYVVQSGDSLSKIAAKLGMSLDELLSHNPDIDPAAYIHPGDEIEYPDSMAARTLPTPSAPVSALAPKVRSTGTQVPMTAAKAKLDLMKLVQDPKMLAIGAVTVVGLAVLFAPKKRTV